MTTVTTSPKQYTTHVQQPPTSKHIDMVLAWLNEKCDERGSLAITLSRNPQSTIAQKAHERVDTEIKLVERQLAQIAAA